MSDITFGEDCFPDKKLVIRELHGLSAHPIYKTWKRMIARCYIRSVSHYELYGGRGIRVCANWHRFASFMEDMQPTWESGLSLDRIDPNGHYSRSNCRWATFRMQTHNRRRNLDIEFRGQQRKLSEVAEQFSTVDYPTLYNRVKSGWDIESALSTAPLKECRRKPFTLMGVHYLTLRGCSKSTGMSCQRIVNLIKRGEGKYL